MNVLQGLDLVHIKVLGILSTDYSSSSPKQVFFLKSAFNVRLVSDTFAEIDIYEYDENGLEKKSKFIPNS